MKPADSSPLGRRSFFKSAGMAAAGASALSFATERDAEATLQNVSTRSMPSDLKITDLRVAVVAKAPMTCPIIRIDTNQGISGYGEVRDGASKTYALMLKNRLIGENPCNVDKVFRKIKQFGAHGAAGRRRVRRRDGAAGTSRARRSACRSTRCSAASSATGCGSTRTRPSRARGVRRTSRARGSRSAWTAASRS